MMIKPITSTLAALAIAGLLGACGGGSGGDEGSNDDPGEQAGGEEGGQALYDWVECMRGEGIEVPDPTRDANGNLVITGDGWDIRPPAVGQPGEEASFGQYSDEEMQLAQEACGPPPMADPGVRSDEAEQQEREQMLALAECMREQGVEDFPDPDFSNVGEIESEPGEGAIAAGPLRITEEVEQDPEFEAASEACEDEAFAPSEGSGEGSEG